MLKSLKADLHYIHKKLRTNIPLFMTEANTIDFQNSVTCYICSKPFKNQYDKCADHLHLDGSYRGACCRRCNWQLYSRTVTCLTHGLTNFDGHVLIQCISRDSVHVRKVHQILARSMERFITFTISFRCDGCIEHGVTSEVPSEEEEEDDGEEEEMDVSNKKKKRPRPSYCYCDQIEKLTFKDSYLFLSASLSKLSDQLRTNVKPLSCEACTPLIECKSCQTKRDIKDVFPYTFEYVKSNFGEKHLPMLLGKQVYCYSYVDSYDRLDEQEFPAMTSFYNKLTEKDITPEEYLHAKRVWTELKFTTLRQYAALYLSLDVTLLTDIFLDFRRLCLEHFQLDPGNFTTLPALALSAALKRTGVKLQLITDATMYQFSEKQIRGGISFVGAREGRANLPHRSDYRPNEPARYLQYYDMTNLVRKFFFFF